MEYRLGDLVQLKKGHPCGRNEWMILRTGVDMKLKCTGCDRELWVKRVDVNKNIRKIKNSEGKFVAIKNFVREE